MSTSGQGRSWVAQAGQHPPHRYNAALAGRIERDWRDRWGRDRTFAALNPGDAGFERVRDLPKAFVLDMFPYPSGAGLHVGHPLGYIATDIYARWRRMTGHNVLHAMGYDAFGLPAEQYAVATGQHPRITTERNIARMREQLSRLGVDHDPARSVATIDKAYLRWTQWIFLQIYNAWWDDEQSKARPIDELISLFERGERAPVCEQVNPQGASWDSMSDEQRRRLVDAHRLAYLAQVNVNWCPALGTVLANEEVTADGRSERGSFPVFKRPLRQWMLRITRYAPRLLKDLELVNWPEPIKIMQRNWIGRSEGASITFPVADWKDGGIEVFTTRPDTLVGATFLALAPEHPLVEELVAATWPDSAPGAWKGASPAATPQGAVGAYRQLASAKSDVERQVETRDKTGVYLGVDALNPVSGERMPIFIADYVMMGYGTGAIMAVPAHDQRDFDFAQQFGLAIRDAVMARPMHAARWFVKQALKQPDFPQGWELALADFLALVVSNTIEPDGYEDALAKILHQRDFTPDDGATPETVIEARDQPGAVGARRGALQTVWLEAMSDLIERGVQGAAELLTGGRYTESTGAAFTDPGVAVNSPAIEGLSTADAKRRMIDWLAEHGIGRGCVNFKLRDWLFSRQRYWGEPFPIVYDESGLPVALPESQLPVELPEMDDFAPKVVEGADAAPPEPPLARAADWKSVTLDLGDGPRRYTRELNTMPQWAGSCWYYLRYLDPNNDKAFCDPEVERYWMAPSESNPSGGVDLYVGGAEHAVLHLLYARFWHKVLFDLGYVSTVEPFGRLFSQGYIQAHAYTDERGVYVNAEEVSESAPGSGVWLHEGKPVRREYGKMGKSLKNSVAPDDIIRDYGADTLRLYLMYLGPLDASKPWSTRDIVGVHRFLQRAWRNIIDEQTGEVRVVDEASDDPTKKLLHRTIAGVGADMKSLSFNTAIAKLIEFNHHLTKLVDQRGGVPIEVAKTFSLLLAPLAPHIAEELWTKLGGVDSLAHEPYPVADESLLVERQIEMPVQVGGKVRGKITVAVDAGVEEIEAAALASERVRAFLEGKTVRKVVVVPGRLVNIVAS